MKEILALEIDALRPSPERLLAGQGYAGGAAPPRVMAALDEALALLDELADPRALWAAIGREAFAAVYRGRGDNAPETPLADMVPRAESLALYAVTLGGALSAAIGDLFDRHDFALAALLDAAASEAVENAAGAVQARFDVWRPAAGGAGETLSLRYSPGYCGWHLSGQRALFDHLHPEAIGITLQDNFLMRPLKSMTGVIVAGAPSIHGFDDSFPFCADCAEHGCRDRIAGLHRRRGD